MKNDKEPWKKLHRYWLSKHEDGRPPARRDLDPLVEITPLIPNLILLDLEDGDYRYRLVGTEVAKRSGLDMTGRLIGLTITEPGMRDQWRAGLDTVAQEQTPQLFLSLMPPGVTARFHPAPPTCCGIYPTRVYPTPYIGPILAPAAAAVAFTAVMAYDNPRTLRRDRRDRVHICWRGDRRPYWRGLGWRDGAIR